ncbi:MAG TPA: LamG-like jellyroll fold domain-containing protein, partial [Cytophagaceae bacterium]
SVTIPNHSDFTIETFFNICGSGAYKIFDNRGSTAGDGVELVINTVSATSIQVGMRGDDKSNANLNYSQSSVQTSTWHHIAIVHRHSDSTNFLYMNGNKIEEWKADVNPTYTQLYIGRSDHSASSFAKGYIDELRLSKNMRYTGDNYSVPSSEFTNDENTLALYHFNEDRLSTTFSDASGNNSTLSAKGQASTFSTTITVSENIIVAGNSTTLTGPDGAVSYTWSPEATLNSSTEKTVAASPTSNTWYILAVADTNSCIVKDSVEIEVSELTGYTKDLDKNQFTVYPVPAKKEITVNFANDNNTAELAILNMYGEIIKVMPITTGSSIDLSQFPKGIYFVRLTTADASSERRILIE